MLLLLKSGRALLKSGRALGGASFVRRRLATATEVLPVEAQMVIRLLKGEEGAKADLQTLSKEQLQDLFGQLPDQMTSGQVINTAGKTKGACSEAS
jgi:hypothetical protein